MKEIKKSFFFAGKKKGELICTNAFDNISLSDIGFSGRFTYFIKRLGGLNTLTDLLNTDYADFKRLPECRKKTIQNARDKILDLLGNIQSFPFLKYQKFKLSDIPAELMNSNPRDLNFDIKFLRLMERTPEVKTVRDLLNSRPDNFSKILNGSIPSIKKAQKYLSNLLKGKIKIPPAHLKFLYSRLTENDKIKFYPDNEELLNSELSRLDFDIRFKNIARNFLNIGTLKELLNTSTYFFLTGRNCGIETIRKAQDHIIDLFSAKHNNALKTEKKIDENILTSIRKIIKNERDLKIFLRYYSYNNQSKISLGQFGVQNGISRERIRQIISANSGKIIYRLDIFEELVNYMKSFGYIYDMERFIFYLIKNNLWEKDNNKFAEALIIKFITGRFNITVMENYVITINTEILKPVFNKINKLILNKLKGKQNGINAEEMIIFLKDKIKVTGELDKNKLLNPEILTYISNETKNFHVVESKNCNEMIIQKLSGP